MPNQKKIFLRADGNSEIGLGHIVRCLALAEMLYHKYQCHFLIKAPDDKVKEMISKYARVIELPFDLDPTREIDALSEWISNEDILITDNYELSSDFQQQVKKKVKKLVSIDDEARFHFYADLVLNHASPAMAKKYDTEPYTQVLAGPAYLIARAPFRNAALHKRTINTVTSAFICMGGADPYNITCKVIDAALSLPFNRVVVVTGSAFQHTEELKSRMNDTRVEWKTNLIADEMILLISSCEVAVSTASSISLEICCVKSGLLTGIVADNQQNIYQCLVDSGCAQGIGDFRNVSEDTLAAQLKKLMDPETINTQIQQQSLLIDGKSGERILEKINTLVS